MVHLLGKQRVARRRPFDDFWRNFRNLFLKIPHVSGSQKENGSVTAPEMLHLKSGVSTQGVPV
jgi:hypothetical protein